MKFLDFERQSAEEYEYPAYEQVERRVYDWNRRAYVRQKFMRVGKPTMPTRAPEPPLAHSNSSPAIGRVTDSRKRLIRYLLENPHSSAKSCADGTQQKVGNTRRILNSCIEFGDTVAADCIRWHVCDHDVANEVLATEVKSKSEEARDALLARSGTPFTCIEIAGQIDTQGYVVERALKSLREEGHRILRRGATSSSFFVILRDDQEKEDFPESMIYEKAINALISQVQEFSLNALSKQLDCSRSHLHRAMKFAETQGYQFVKVGNGGYTRWRLKNAEDSQD